MADNTVFNWVSATIARRAFLTGRNNLSDDLTREILNTISQPTDTMLAAAWDAGCTGDNGGHERAPFEEEWAAVMAAYVAEG